MFITVVIYCTVLEIQNISKIESYSNLKLATIFIHTNSSRFLTSKKFIISIILCYLFIGVNNT